VNPILLARHVEDSLRELVHATLNTTSPAFNGTVERFLENPTNFLKGPWISADMPFRQVGQADAWAQPFPEIPLGFRPFRHQSLAFERLGGSAARSTLIATGTGSGKTESYLWPILDYCRQHKDEPGIKAVLIYPMNALASDQARRIAKALTEHPSLEGVTAGVYADAEPEDAAHAVTPESLITHRESMRRRPPDILLTNYKMLDYLLLRGSDRRLWEENDPQTLRYVVVDELHTFDGAQGADLALLLRRLKERLNTPEERLVCVGSSATLGSGEDAKTSLQEYARTIFGEPFDEDSVIGESRKTPEEDFPPPEYFEVPRAAEIREALEEAVELDQSMAASRLAACLFDQASDEDALALETGDPKSMEWRVLLFRLLSEHHITQRILTLIYDAKKPLSLDEIAEALGRAKMFGDWGLIDLRALAEVVISLLTWARRREDGVVRPAYNIRCQLWMREMTRIAADLPARRDDGGLSPVTLYHALDVDKDRLRTLLPVVNCNRCGAAAHLAKEPRGSSSYWATLEELYESFFDDAGSSRIRLFYYDSLERRVGAAGADKRIYAGVLDTTEIAFRSNAQEENANEIPVWMYDPTDDRGRIDRTCPACGYPQGLLIFGMRGARLTTGVTSTLYTSQQNEEDPLAKPRFLMFSDSVQDAAHRGAIAELRNAFSVAQKSLHEALDQTPEAQRTLEDVIEAVPAEYRAALGGDAFTAKFIARDQAWRRPYQDLVSLGTSIDDESFLRQVELRLGWEYFVDLTYRAHFSHTLEAHAMASVGASIDGLGESAERLAQTLANEFPHAAPIQAENLVPFLAGVVERMRRQGGLGRSSLFNSCHRVG
jgi:DEAD/DEAH box helicase domain-containing protein